MAAADSAAGPARAGAGARDVSCFPRMVDVVPPGASADGRVAVERVVVSPAYSRQLMLYAAATGSGRGPTGGDHWDVPPGEYLVLRVDGRVMMSDVPFERRSNLRAVDEARGDVLIAGLGIGMILWPIAAKPGVRSITVVEYDPRVIALVAPHIPQVESPYTAIRSIRIVEADAFRFHASPIAARGFDTIYFDIWHTIDHAALPQMIALEHDYRPRLRRGGWMGSWHRADVEACARRLREMRDRVGPEPRRFLSPADECPTAARAWGAR